MKIFRFNSLTAVVSDFNMTKSLAFKPMKSPAQKPRALLYVFAVTLLGLSSVASHAQDSKHALDYGTIVVFGDSLSDTGNVADLTAAKYGVRIPGPDADYTDGRFTDGADTEPFAENYFGVWIEQLAATFPSKPVVKASLDGGTDYAYGFAFTGNGSSVFTFGPSDSLSVNVNNIGQQITDYLATKPKITDRTLYVVWGGANDVLNATTQDEVIEAGLNQILNIQRLIDAGATHLIVPNLPPLGLVPRLNGSLTTSIPATEGAQLYNEVLASGLALLRDVDRSGHIELAQLDVFTLFNKIVAAPPKFALANVTDSSQGAGVDPDTYLFWDGLHPTTHGHNILAEQASKVLASSQAELEAVR
jgi:phospholipase/lecithinase/hemolysin